jgi:hypothetical protein
MEETFTAKLIHALVFLAICAGIILLGWNEPLRYRFMSAEEISALEQPPPPPTPPATPPWIDTRKVPTKLNDPSRPARGMGPSTHTKSALDR